ncbi:MAG: iron-only hydrogenase system regulator [Bacteroidetes bacterium]|nr:iron-only hydrogenase system regulator [Bacteroidota bacterium]MBU1116447.1 iron-only hydrogenase system regulator [Bacteroidota bacterium]MBU1800026.1 iron-only hydrogenase system regulator [Bacteroidota bacterium]
MEKKYHTITITIYDRNFAFNKVGELLHEYAEDIHLRVGYPVPDKNTSVIFIIVTLTNNELGALSGKLGQIDSVKVKSTTLKF